MCGNPRTCTVKASRWSGFESRPHQADHRSPHTPIDAPGTPHATPRHHAPHRLDYMAREKVKKGSPPAAKRLTHQQIQDRRESDRQHRTWYRGYLDRRAASRVADPPTTRREREAAHLEALADAQWQVTDDRLQRAQYGAGDSDDEPDHKAADEEEAHTHVEATTVDSDALTVGPSDD